MSLFSSFLFKLILTVVISVFIGFQLAKLDFARIWPQFKSAEYSFRKMIEPEVKIEIDQTLQSSIENFLKGQDGDYAIFVKDLNQEGDKVVCIRCEESFEAASLYKVFLMAAVFGQVNEGKVTLDSEISAKMSHLEEVYGGVDSGYEDFDEDEVISYTVREALQRVATISDNFAALLLAEKVGWNAVQSVADEIGAENTSIRSPITTSTRDVGVLFEKLYQGQVVNLNSSEQILDLLTLSKLNNRIPDKLPPDLKIAHKTGELSGVRNDAGVVFLAGTPYVIVEMSKNLKGEDDGVEVLSEISKIVYEYYSANVK